MEAKKTRKMYIYALDEKSKRNQKEEGEMSQLHGEPPFHFVSNVTLASKEEISSVFSLAANLALKHVHLKYDSTGIFHISVHRQLCHLVSSSDRHSDVWRRRVVSVSFSIRVAGVLWPSYEKLSGNTALLW